MANAATAATARHDASSLERHAGGITPGGFLSGALTKLISARRSYETRRASTKTLQSQCQEKKGAETRDRTPEISPPLDRLVSTTPPSVG